MAIATATKLEATYEEMRRALRYLDELDKAVTDPTVADYVLSALQLAFAFSYMRSFRHHVVTRGVRRILKTDQQVEEHRLVRSAMLMSSDPSATSEEKPIGAVFSLLSTSILRQNLEALGKDLQLKRSKSLLKD